MELEQFLNHYKDCRVKVFGEVNQSFYLVADERRCLYNFNPPQPSQITAEWDEENLPYLKESYIVKDTLVQLRYYRAPRDMHEIRRMHKLHLAAIAQLPQCYKEHLNRFCQAVGKFVAMRDAFSKELNLDKLDQDLLEQYFGAADLWLGPPETIPGMVDELAIMIFLARVDSDKLTKKADLENSKRTAFFVEQLLLRQAELKLLLEQHQFQFKAEIDGVSFQTRYQEDVRKNRHIESCQVL